MAVSIVVLAHITALLVAALVLVWALAFRTTFLLPSSSGGGATAVTHLDQLYSVNGPLFFSPPHPPSCFSSFCTLHNDQNALASSQVLHPLLMVIGFILLAGEGITDRSTPLFLS